MNTFHAAEAELLWAAHWDRVGDGLVPSSARCVFSIIRSIAPKMTILGKSVQLLAPSETSARTWQHRAHSGVKCFEGKPTALGKKNLQCLCFMFFPQQEDNLLTLCLKQP